MSRSGQAVPEGHPKLAQRFNAEIRAERKPGPEGTTQTIQPASKAPLISTSLKRGANETGTQRRTRFTGASTFLSLLLMTSFFLGTASSSRAATDPKVAETVTGNTAFATDLYQRERAKPGNLFFSPYSISTALAMTYIGARGQTATEMAQTLHLNIPQAELPPAFAELVREMEAIGRTQPLMLDVANSLWCQQGFPILDSFLKLTHNDFDAEARLVDFVGNAEPVRLEINAWIAKKTQDKIRDLLQPGRLSADTRLVLCNAIYFKGQWLARFDPKATHTAPFFLGNGQQVQIPLMTQSLRLRSRQFDNFDAFALPYTSNELSMIILLPKAVDGLGALEKGLDSANLGQWLSALDAAPETKADLFLPKFKLNCRLDLAGTLSALGMPTAFSANADFSGITSTPSLRISDVVHQAFVDVNEEGTEAAAATAVVMRLTASVQRTPVLRVDHPFLFLIRENRTGSILFLGRVVDPSL